MELLKIKIQPKRLASGKCQVRFQAEWANHRSCYGYVLTEPDTLLKDMMGQLKTELRMMQDKDQFYHANLYKLPIAPIKKSSQLWVMMMN